MKEIRYTKAALKSMSRLPLDARRIIAAKLARYAETGAGDVTKLVGDGGARLRTGDYRAVFDETDTVVEVIAVGHRREIYR